MAQLVTLLKAAMAATRLPTDEFLKALARECATGNPAPSHPSRQTIMSYQEAIEKNDLRARCSPRVVDLVRALLHKRRKSTAGKRYNTACRLCDEALRSLRELRYGHSIGTDPAHIQRINELCGAYAVCRTDTGAATAGQELLVLNHEGRGAAKTYATLISADVIVRGRFFIIGRVLWCSMTGYRERSRSDMINLFMAEDGTAPMRVLVGVGIGLATVERLPAVLPVLAIKIDEVSAATKTIGDKGDLVLREAFKTALKDRRRKTTEILGNTVLNDPIIRPRLAAEIRGRIENGEDLILPSIRTFCSSTHTALS
jgi:hypothetical protein